jgi:hypothetical protein
MCLYVPQPLCARLRNISIQFVYPAWTIHFFILPCSPSPWLPLPTPQQCPSFFSARRRSLFSARPASPRLAPATPGRHSPTMARVKSSAHRRSFFIPRRRSFFNARPASPHPAPAAPERHCPVLPGRTLLTPASAALPVSSGPGPSLRRCARQPGLWPVPPHPSAQASISPAIVVPVRLGSGRHRPGRALAAPASAAPTLVLFTSLLLLFPGYVFYSLMPKTLALALDWVYCYESRFEWKNFVFVFHGEWSCNVESSCFASTYALKQRETIE